MEEYEGERKIDREKEIGRVRRKERRGWDERCTMLGMRLSFALWLKLK